MNDAVEAVMNTAEEEESVMSDEREFQCVTMMEEDICMDCWGCHD